jgi:hypothetical protein
MHEKARCCSINNAAGPNSPDLGWRLNGVSHTHSQVVRVVWMAVVGFLLLLELKGIHASRGVASRVVEKMVL